MKSPAAWLSSVLRPSGRHRNGTHLPPPEDEPTAVIRPVAVPVPAKYEHVEELHTMPDRDRAYWLGVLEASARAIGK